MFLDKLQTLIHIIINSNLINFLLVIAFLVWIEKKTHILSVIGERKNLIRRVIASAEQDKEKAQEELASVKEQVKNSDEIVQNILNEADDIAKGLSGRISQETDITAEEMRKKAERVLEIEKEVASNEVLKEVSRTAFIVAEEHIKKAIDTRLHKKFIDEVIDGLDNLKV